MRGKGFPRNHKSLRRGITPAYAGKRMPLLARIPRAVGSPPPMRGKAEAFPVADFFVGITPAYAGKSL